VCPDLLSPGRTLLVSLKGKPPAKKPTSKKTSTKAKAKKATKSAKASKSSKGRGDSSARTTRARPSAPAPKPEPASKPSPAASPAAVPRSLGFWKPGPGRPKGTPDVWTDEHKAEVAGWIYDYTDANDLPEEAEFCMLYGVRHQRLGEFEELKAAKEYLQAKRSVAIRHQSLELDKETGARASYLNRMAANCGTFSLVEKSDLNVNDQKPINLVINPAILSENDPDAEVSRGD